MNLHADLMSQPIVTRTKVLRHGGDLTDALQIYGGEPNDWLDLSTGISPWSYPVTAIDNSLWQSLPSKPDKLLGAASAYYNCTRNSITITPGSQLAIRLLPRIIPSQQRVAIPSIGYQEHAHSWQLAGHKVVHYQSCAELHELLAGSDVENAVVINPNNPSCETITAAQLRLIASQLSGLLIVDEAFADLDPTNSLSSDADLSNILVLRSIGKFFGLAGARIGFVITHNKIAAKIAALLDPWSINAPAQQLAELALLDRQWQNRQCLKISSQAIELKKLIDNSGQCSSVNFKHVSAGLFTTISDSHSRIKKLHTRLAEDHIWTRIGDPYPSPNHNKSILNWLRLSLPGNHLHRLSTSLNRHF